MTPCRTITTFIEGKLAPKLNVIALFSREENVQKTSFGSLIEDEKTSVQKHAFLSVIIMIKTADRTGGTYSEPLSEDTTTDVTVLLVSTWGGCRVGPEVHVSQLAECH